MSENMRKKKMEDIKKAVKQEFPNDFALQQVHIARKILAEEAKEKGISFWKYIKIVVDQEIIATEGQVGH